VAPSNPIYLQLPFRESDAYLEQLRDMDGLTPKEKYEGLAIRDIREAAKILRPLYDMGSNGYISIEVDPRLSNDREATGAEAKRLFNAIGEPKCYDKDSWPGGWIWGLWYELIELWRISVNGHTRISPGNRQKTSFYQLIDEEGISKL